MGAGTALGLYNAEPALAMLADELALAMLLTGIA